MNHTRKALVFASLLLVALAAAACSVNRQMPAELDAEAMEVDVRAAIASAVPGKTFDLGVTVNNGRVTLTGDVDTAADRDAIVRSVRDVNGVRSVDATGIRIRM